MATHVAPRRDFHALEVRQQQAARLFAAGKETQGAIARRLGVSRQSVLRWYRAWRAGGRNALCAAGRAGRKPRLGSEAWTGVEAALRQGPRAHGYRTNLWTLPRVARVIERLTGVRYHPGHVWRLLGALNWTLQRPAKRAKERNETAIRHWVTTRWPAVKKRAAPASLARLPGRERGLAAPTGPAHVGAAGRDAGPDPRLQLDEALRRPGVGLPVGRPPHAPVLPNAAGELQRRHTHRLPDRSQVPLSGSTHPPDLGRPAVPQEPRDGRVPAWPAAVALGRALARARARAAAPPNAPECPPATRRRSPCTPDTA